MPDFILSITLGNENMRTSDDVAYALTEVTEKLLNGKTSGTVRDINGNTVGQWTLPENWAAEPARPAGSPS